jgi:hypothetical protein
MEGHADCDWVVNTKSAAAREVYILQEQADLIGRQPDPSKGESRDLYK